MDANLMVRIDGKLKERFAEIAKEKGTDPSTLVREFVDNYVKENQSIEQEEMNTMWEAGNQLQKSIGIEKSFIVSRNLMVAPINKFVETVMVELIGHNVQIPKQLLSVKDKPALKNIFIAGLIGE